MESKKRSLLLRALVPVAIAGGLLALAAGCGNQPKQAVNNPVIEAPSPTPSPSPTPPPYTYPLTGLGTGQEPKQRPIMVMIENSPAARPQTGLDQADVIYEILAEGEITRFAALFHSQSPEVIGPVRSIRPYYVEIGESHHAVIVHAGWSQDAINMIKKRKLNHLDEVYGDTKYYWRDNSRSKPHNLFTSMERMLQGAEDKKFPMEWKGSPLEFADKDRIAQGQDAAAVTIPYMLGYEVSYTYHKQTGHYLRSMAGKPHLDGKTGEQLSAANIIICESDHRVLDSEGRRDVDVHGPGEGYLITGGKALNITWERKDGVIRALSGGKEVPLTPGQTWIQFVPTGTEITVS